MKIRRTLLILACSLGMCMALLTTARALTWNVPGDYPTIQAAIESTDVQEGHTILVAPGEHAGATVTKAVEIKGEGGAVINGGPPLPWYPSLKVGFFFAGGGVGSGATITHLSFEGVELPVYSSGADDVTVEHCTMADAIQGVSNWMGTGWQISHNVIIDLRTSNGGGIGILVADRQATQVGVRDNVVSHNKVTGTLHVAANDGGGYNGSGIVLYADFRYGRAGAVAIAGNRVVKNKVSLTSDTPNVVDVVAIELTDSRADATANPYPVIYDNAIGFNDLRGTVLQLDMIPLDLENQNKISRNLGDNRGGPGAMHPSPFGPGGN